MYKKTKIVIKPFQEVLLGRRVCPACMKPLGKAEVVKKDVRPEHDIVKCGCGRLFMHHKHNNTYKRLTLEEEKEFLTKPKK